jgi:selenocysteine lyase/cysteine desulfurase
LRTLIDEIAERAEAIGLSATPAEQRAPHMLGIGLPVEAARAAAEALEAANVVASVRGPSLRIAPHLHTNASEVDRLIEVLHKIG